MAAQQYRSDSSAIDKKVAFDITVLFGGYRANVFIFGAVNPSYMINNVSNAKPPRAMFLQ